ncbi:MAG: sulfite exporter TauE/SafE family protein [Planctomycetes bacterium]|nr:sulfite exporter TauE/SafE family protein [Planctomycetota bacterium]
MIEDLSFWQWALCMIACLTVGFAKTGVPGFGIISVPLFATAIGGLDSVGALLPLLVFADIFAVFWYRRHARWDQLISLIPWVLIGMAAASYIIIYLHKHPGQFFGLEHGVFFDVLIGSIVLTMLGVYFLKQFYGDKITPHSGIAVGSTGLFCGVSTTLANAAGPIMTLYLTGKKLPKEQFMGTSAWYFLILNAAKFPLYMLLPSNGDKSMITVDSLLFNCCLFPLIIIGVYIGRWALHKFSQRAFNTIVVILAGVSAIKLLLSPVW